MEQSHVIQKQVFQISYSDQSRAKQLQDRISAIASHSLQQAIEAVLEKYDKDKLNIRFDEITLNLGGIPEAELEFEIPKRVKEGLSEYLRYQFSQLESGQKKEILKSDEIDQIELLTYFLHYGVLPWWGKTHTRFSPKQLIELLSKSNPNALAQLLKQHKGAKHFIQRLVINASDASIYKLIEKLSPAEAKIVIEIGKDTIKLNEEKQAIRTSRTNFRHKVWEFILTYLLNDRGSYFNTKDFVHSLLFKLAGHFNIEFVSLLQQFQSAITAIKLPPNKRQHLASIIQEIYTEEVAGSKKVAPDQQTKANYMSSHELLTVLSNGKLPTDRKKLRAIESALNAQLEKENRELNLAIRRQALNKDFRTWLKQFKLTKSSQQKLAQLLPKEATIRQRQKKLIAALWDYLTTGQLLPAHGGFSKTNLLHQLKEQLDSGSKDLSLFIIKHGKSYAFRKRLIDFLDEAYIKKVIVAIEPNDAPVIFEVADKLEEIRAQKTVPISANASTFRKLKWEFILSALLVDRGSRFNLKSFVKSTLQNLAAHFNINIQDFIHHALIHLKQTEKSIKSSDLAVVLQALQQEELTAERRKNEAVSTQLIEQVRFNWVQHVVSRLTNPWWAAEHKLGLSGFENIFLKISKTHTVKLRQLLLAQLTMSHKRKFMLSMLSEPAKIRMIEVVQPKSSTAIKFYIKALEKLESEQATKSESLTLQKWDVIIYSLVSDRGSFFNLKSFIMTTLHKLSHHFNIDFETLFTSFISIGSSLKVPETNEFKRAILELQDTFNNTKKATKNQPYQSQKSITILEALAPSFKKHTSIESWLAANEPIDTKSLIKLIKQAGYTERSFAKLIQAAGLETQKLLQQLLTNQALEFLNSYLAKLPHAISSNTKGDSIAELNAFIEATFKNGQWAFTYKKSLVKELESTQLNAEKLIQLFRQKGLSAERLFMIFKQFSPNEQQLLLKRLTTKESMFMEAYHHDLIVLLKHYKNIDRMRIQQIIHAFSLSYLISSKHINKHDYFSALLSAISSHLGFDLKQSKQALDELLNELKQEMKSTLPLSWAKLHQAKSSVKNENESTVQNALERNESKNSEEEDDDQDKGVLVHNAGLVILWPFVTQYFQMLNLLEENSFKTPEDAVKGVHLLHYLATGQDEPLEYELYLNKLLCGIAPGTPIATDLGLTKQEKELSESLLNGAIGNWPNMKDTSPQALRESFLQRSGIVEIKYDSIELRVEKKTLDVLLDSMPWGYSVIKFPWTKKPIHVTW
ncbi:hypothetical protein BXY85_0457 [Roseivirga pacifica]|uniref:Uncharacterized protein n=1 Tax=Roseivirga pacifica TaxID=1267423 RepID=A0A1I0RSI1_9BACT|nr:contractile injection system tape measure protein [Roseivirga pacifica]RKQ49468.1 hypothetical protein BXY85_0457 [Roseivirga pacifica]SEW44184.1 hypothetical protein SAMN05216290_4046 [Roseivirga pacifica]